MFEEDKRKNRICMKNYLQTKRGTAIAIFPTSSSACIIFLILACQIPILLDNTIITEMTKTKSWKIEEHSVNSK